jgi:endonuclease YncB( thermonuclease family)
VVSIGDGDTLRLRQAGRLITVRLACIDAPELTQRPWGPLARHYLQERLPLGSVVTLQLKAVDRYGRLVAEVIGELNIGLVMVEDGQAFASPAAMPRSMSRRSTAPVGGATACGR